MWKQRGEEYRVTGGQGWIWVSKTRPVKFSSQDDVGLRGLANKLRAKRAKMLEKYGRMDVDDEGQQDEKDGELRNDEAAKDGDKAAKEVTQGEITPVEGKDMTEKGQSVNGMDVCNDKSDTQGKDEDVDIESTSPAKKPRLAEGKRKAESEGNREDSSTSTKGSSSNQYEPKDSVRLAPIINIDLVDVSKALADNQTSHVYVKPSKPWAKLDFLLVKRLKQEELEIKQRQALQQQINWRVKLQNAQKKEDSNAKSDEKKTEDKDNDSKKEEDQDGTEETSQYTCYSYNCRGKDHFMCYSPLCMMKMSQDEAMMDLTGTNKMEEEESEEEEEEEESEKAKEVEDKDKDDENDKDKDDEDKDDEDEVIDVEGDVKSSPLKAEMKRGDAEIEKENDEDIEVEDSKEDADDTEGGKVEEECGDVTDKEENVGVEGKEELVEEVVTAQIKEEDPGEDPSVDVKEEVVEMRDDVEVKEEVVEIEDDVDVKEEVVEMKEDVGIKEEVETKGDVEMKEEIVEMKDDVGVKEEVIEIKDDLDVKEEVVVGEAKEENVDVEMKEESVEVKEAAVDVKEEVIDVEMKDESDEKTVKMDENVNVKTEGIPNTAMENKDSEVSSTTDSACVKSEAGTVTETTVTTTVVKTEIIQTITTTSTTTKAVGTGGTEGQPKVTLTKVGSNNAVVMPSALLGKGKLKPGSITINQAQMALRQALGRMSVEELKSKMPPQRKTSEPFKLMKYARLGQKPQQKKKASLPSCHKFLTPVGVKTLFALEKHELKRMARKGGKNETKCFNYNCKMNNVNWNYPCPRPLFKTCWRYRTQTVKTFAAVGLQLRIIWACIRWDDMNIKPPAGGTNTISTETEITTKELLKRRDVGPYNLRSEFQVRTIVVPLGIPAQPKGKE